MKTLKDFTPEIRSKISKYISKAKDDLYSGKEYDTNKRKDTVSYIEYIYELVGFKKPVVVIAKNPNQYKYFFELLKKNKKVSLLFMIKNRVSELYSELYSELHSELRSELHSELYSELHSELNSELRSELHSGLYSELHSELYSELHSELRSELHSGLYSELNSELDSELHSGLNSELDSELHSGLYSELHSELHSELNSELRSELHSELYSELNSELNSELRSELHSGLYSELHSELHSELDSLKQRSHWGWFCSIYSRVYLMWYYFIHKEFKIQTSKSKELTKLYNLINKTFISRCYFTKGYVLVLKTPKKIIRNNQFIHSSSEQAIQWEGYGLYYLQGVKINKEIWLSLKNKTYTRREWLEENNQELKSAYLLGLEEMHGSQYLSEFLSLKKIDTHVDKKDRQYLEGTTGGMNIGVYTLMEGEGMKFVRCFCPSTDRMFYLEVEPHHNTAKNAIASLFRVPIKIQNEIKDIARQGERFSYTLTEKGKEIKDTMSKNDWQNTAPLKGEDYFNLMTYEY